MTQRNRGEDCDIGGNLGPAYPQILPAWPRPLTRIRWQEAQPNSDRAKQVVVGAAVGHMGLAAEAAAVGYRLGIGQFYVALFRKGIPAKLDPSKVSLCPEV
jgi:hypothetical protein